MFFTEPNADLRQAAHSLWELYCALIQEGFTESQAIRLIGYSIQSRREEE